MPPDIATPVTITIDQLRVVDSVISDMNKHYDLDGILASLPTPKKFAEDWEKAAKATEEVIAITTLALGTATGGGGCRCRRGSCGSHLG